MASFLTLYLSNIMRYLLSIILCFFIYNVIAQQADFIKVSGQQFSVGDKPYSFAGANYWYGGLLGNDTAGQIRLKKELDFLISKGVTNLRVLGGTEGKGQINGVTRVEPALQTTPGQFNEDVLKGLDFLLTEMGKRKMKAVIFLSNNWEWSGGFLQYLNWNNKIADSVLFRKLAWDEMRDYVSEFYDCEPCVSQYQKQVSLIINRTNSVTGLRYIDDPSIMAWELANEPRPMRPAVIEKYKKWIKKSAKLIKELDKNHLVTIGSEGEMGSESLNVFEAVHSFKDIDYATIHIWPKNWSWFKDTAISKDFKNIVDKTVSYIDKHAASLTKMNKPLVIEEFGLPRDLHIFTPGSSTGLRDAYYDVIFKQHLKSKQDNSVIAGTNFWAFGGTGRPSHEHLFWQTGDDMLGDPPMEEQGLNSVFDNDESTWAIIKSYSEKLKNDSASSGFFKTIDANATKETMNLFSNLKKIESKGYMFGHQDDLAYGVNWKYQNGRSDVREAGGDYPAVYGWELGNIEIDLPNNIDGVPFSKMRQYIKEGYDRGGVITISWHTRSPFGFEKGAWDTTHGSVASILPGGINNGLYKTWLNKVANFLTSLKGKNSEQIPVLFRPFHELTGNWFWWCKNACTEDEFKTLWKYTVYYLKDIKQLHNLIYVYNVADFNSEEAFLQRYPGDDVVDMLSFDSYQSNDPETDKTFSDNLKKRLSVLEKIAAEKNKLASIGETGYEGIPHPAWWTEVLYDAIGNSKISYVLVWRNHGYHNSMKKMHYYAPFKGQVSEKDFKKFAGFDNTLFESDVRKENLYK